MQMPAIYRVQLINILNEYKNVFYLRFFRKQGLDTLFVKSTLALNKINKINLYKMFNERDGFIKVIIKSTDSL